MLSTIPQRVPTSLSAKNRDDQILNLKFTCIKISVTKSRKDETTATRKRRLNNRDYVTLNHTICNGQSQWPLTDVGIWPLAEIAGSNPT